MIRSYLKVAWRNLERQKLNSVINIGGMTLGITSFLMLTLYMQYESSYDLQHAKSSRIYRVAQSQKGNEFRGTDKFASAPMTLVPAMKHLYSEVEDGTTITFRQTRIFREGQALYEQGVYADEHFLDVFTYPVVEGVGKEALMDINSIILTESMARKYFGSSSPIGKSMELDNALRLIVKGVISDVPPNQHFDFQFITSIRNFSEYESDANRWKWESNIYRAYIVLPSVYDYKDLEGKMRPLSDLAKPFYDQYSFYPHYFLQPLQDIHLHSNINMEIEANGDIRYIYLASAIAFIILLLALINYMNLALTRASQRIREVGVRKVLGANRKQLIGQFLWETLLVMVISFFLAMGLVGLLLPSLSNALEISIPFDLNFNRTMLAGLMLLAIILALCAGIYPALVLSASSPVNALQGKWFGLDVGNSFIAKGLTIGQFTSAIVLAICSVVIYQQLNFIQHKKLGYNRDQIVFIPYEDQPLLEKSATLKAELLKHPGVEKYSLTNTMPLDSENQGIVDMWEGNATNREQWIYRNWVDYNFLDLFEIDLLDGRNFTEDLERNQGSYILNEAAVKALGWESAVGKSFADGTVIGVVKDFHFQPFTLSIEPMFIALNNEYTSRYGNIVLKVETSQYDDIVSHVRETLHKVIPELPFDIRFMDESYFNSYQSERSIGRVFTMFTIIALIIACMGLFGLVTHSVLRRRKEVGIRKVLGATISNIVSLLSKDFLVLVFFSAFIALPIAWWMMDNWLEDYAYRISIDWWVIALTAFVTTFMALLTIACQALSAATTNPVDAIRDE